jgi:hypothetical protein
MDPFLYDEMFRGEPEKSIKLWEKWKTREDLSFEKCFEINNSLEIAAIELILNKHQEEIIEKYIKESSDKLSELYPLFS